MHLKSFTSDDSDDEAMRQEFDHLSQDLRAKQQFEPPTPFDSDLTFSKVEGAVDETTKMHLAKRVSQVSATTPGAVQGGGRWNGRSKPTQDQLAEMGNLRLIQKNRRSELNREEDVPEPLPPDEEEPIGEFQRRMSSYQESENDRIMLEKHEKNKRHSGRRKIIIFSTILIVCILVGVAVGVSTNLIPRKSKTKDNNKTLDDCLMRINTIESNVFLNLRNLLLNVSGWDIDDDDFDVLGTSQRAALCWLSEIDQYKIKVVEGDNYEILERFALASIYYHFVGSSRMGDLANTNWLSATHVCDWYYVECEGSLNGVVTKIELHDLSLDAALPKEIGMLTSLTFLRVESSSLIGQIPLQLWNLSQLEVLDFSNNLLTGRITSELANMGNLRTIIVFKNKLTGPIPSQLFNLPRLEVIDFAENRFEGTLSPAIQNATSLMQFSVLANDLTGPLPDLSLLTHLNALILGDNNFKYAFPDLSQAFNLERLIMGPTLISGTIPSFLWSLQSLALLNLSNTLIKGTIPNEAVNLTNLVSLQLSRTSMSGTIPTMLGTLSGLRILTLAIDSARTPVPSELGRLSVLETLEIGGTIIGSIPPEVCALTSGTLSFFRGPQGHCDCCNFNY